MTMMICSRCGSGTTKEARFCANCGAIAPLAETANLYAPEPGIFCGKEIEQTVPPHAAVTEEMPVIMTALKVPSNDNDAGSQP